ncbi:MAG: 2Fe-2S iron-sulfur cluster-binding protein [Anaerolineae bacterium]|nr:2Fe-2S iron-sulfur cluster-binding protein [Anaerolineae bacterium]
MSAETRRATRRLAGSPSQVIDRSRPLTFTWQGRPYTAYEGDTIASALAAAGVETFSRSFKYHRRRGLLCVSGDCPNCLVRAGDEPNVRACRTRVEAGMDVRAQNAWPSLDTDVMSLTQLASRFLPPGFYYKTFTRPRALWPFYEGVLRRAAGLGAVDPDAAPARFDHKVYEHADVLVAGGGPAGMRAALAAAGAGARVLLLEEQDALGGHLRYSGGDVNGQPAHEAARALAAEVRAHPNVTVMLDTLVIGAYDHGWFGAVQGKRLLKVRATAAVVAAGAHEQPLVFANNDLPGIMLASGVARLLHLWGVLPGRRAVVVSANPRGLQLARDLLQAGCAVTVAEMRATPEAALVEALRAGRVELLTGATVLQASGSKRVESVTLTLPGGETRVIPCDLLVLATGYLPANGLLNHAGAKPVWNAALNEFVPAGLRAGMFAAGEINGTHALAPIEREGTLAGLQAARFAGYGGDATENEIARLSAEVAAAQAQRAPWTPAQTLAPEQKKDFVCFCEDVTQADVRMTIEEGYDSMELLKRYSTISMGPCQGKMCNMAAMRLCAHHNRLSIGETGTTTARPPTRPVSLGVLGGRLLEPVRYTPLHDWHRAHGAILMNAGQWQRPEHYGDPLAEVRAVRAAVGLIDVSTLGKLLLEGSQVPDLLERIYTNRWRRLARGRVRYGLMVNEEGVVMDDGVTARLDDDRYYLTATTGGAGAVYEWIEWWLQSGWQLDARVVDVTELYAAMNLAGPYAREVLAAVASDLDLRDETFPYLGVRRGTVAGAPATLMRIGFTGELSYEIHVPAGYGLHVWQALMDAGAQYGIRPFGVEAQRILRLEKGHIIVGQDTDGLTNPFEAGMAWVVKTDKLDFLGRRALLMSDEQGHSKRLVGFTITGGALPEEGNQIVRPGAGPTGLEIIGRITSVRYSPTLDRVIGLCWLPVEMAMPGRTFTVRARGELLSGEVVATPFYDPEEVRLRG